MPACVYRKGNAVADWRVVVLAVSIPLPVAVVADMLSVPVIVGVLEVAAVVSNVLVANLLELLVV